MPVRTDDRSAALCVSIHDVAPATWTACEKIITALREVADVPCTLLVVPDYHRRGRVDGDAAFLAAMETCLGRGDEIALHGYYHLDDAPSATTVTEHLRRRLYTAGEGEFASLSADLALARLEAGRQIFERLGWPVPGFVAPAWLLGPGAWQALAQSPFSYTTTLQGLHDLKTGRYWPSQSLVYSVRAPWRIWLSRRWNPYLFRRLTANPLLRLSLHPADAAHPAVMRDWQLFLERALENRQAMTKSAFLRQCA